MCRGLQPVWQWLVVPAGAARSLRELQRVRHLQSLRRRRFPPCSGQPAIPAEDDEPLMIPDLRSKTGRALSPEAPAPMLQSLRSLLLLLLVSFSLASALAEQRFPPPEFTETNHQQPATTTPGPRLSALEYLDLAMLA